MIWGAKVDTINVIDFMIMTFTIMWLYDNDDDNVVVDDDNVVVDDDNENDDEMNDDENDGNDDEVDNDVII